MKTDIDSRRNIKDFKQIIKKNNNKNLQDYQKIQWQCE